MSDWSCRFIRDTGRDFLVLSRLGPCWRSRNMLINHPIPRIVSPMPPLQCLSSMLTAVEGSVKISPRSGFNPCPLVHEPDYPCITSTYTTKLPLVSPCTLLFSPVLQTLIQSPSFTLFWDLETSYNYRYTPLDNLMFTCGFVLLYINFADRAQHS